MVSIIPQALALGSLRHWVQNLADATRNHATPEKLILASSLRPITPLPQTIEQRARASHHL